MEAVEMVKCKICGKMIEASKIRMHEIGCARQAKMGIKFDSEANSPANPVPEKVEPEPV